MRYVILILILLCATTAWCQTCPCPNGVCPAQQPAYQTIQVPAVWGVLPIVPRKAIIAPAMPQACLPVTAMPQACTAVDLPAAYQVVGIVQPRASAGGWFAQHKPVRKAVAAIFRFLFHRRR